MKLFRGKAGESEIQDWPRLRSHFEASLSDYMKPWREEEKGTDRDSDRQKRQKLREYMHLNER